MNYRYRYDTGDTTFFNFPRMKEQWSGEHTDLENDLNELFSTEYAIGELKRRIYINKRLQFSKRCETWIRQLEDHALKLAEKIIPQIVEAFEKWYSNHTTSGFARMVIGDLDSGSAIDDNGVVVLGGGFEYDLYDVVLDEFLKDGYFVNEFINELNQIEAENQKDNPGYVFEPYQFGDVDLVKSQIEDIYPDYPSLLDLINHNGSAEDIVEYAITNYVFPVWRQYWGQAMERADEDVLEAIAMMKNALYSGQVNEMTVAINFALQVQHVNGGMIEHVGISARTLDHLSNIPTKPIDQFVDQITGPDWKTSNTKINRHIFA